MRYLSVVVLLCATPVAASNAFEDAAAKAMDEINALWSAQLGGVYKPALWTTYDAELETPCGASSPANPPFYCPVDAKIYLGFEFFNTIATQIPDAALAEFVMTSVVAHEIGHHIQYLRGFGGPLETAQDALAAKGKQDSALFLSRRIELQADCFSGIWAHHRFAEMTPAEITVAHSATNQLAHAFDDDAEHVASHGNGDQRIQWFDAGSAHGAPGDCDTFTNLTP